MRARLSVLKILAVFGLVLATSCGSDAGSPIDAGADEPTIEPTLGTTEGTVADDGASDPDGSGLDGSEALDAYPSPPPLMVRSGDETFSLDAFTFCWTTNGNGICADGIPSDPLPTLQSDDPVILTFAPEDWSFGVHGMSECEPGSWRIEQLNENEWSLSVSGPPGRRELSLFGRGPQGDAFFGLAVEITVENSLVGPTGSIEPFNLVYPFRSGDLRIVLEGSLSEGSSHSVRIRIVGADGSEFMAEVPRLEDRGACHAIYGLDWTVAGEVADVVGAAPWTFTVVVSLPDGTTYEAQHVQVTEPPPPGDDNGVHAIEFQPLGS